MIYNKYIKSKGETTMLIKQNGVHGGKVGNKMVFTVEGAERVFRLFARECYSNMSIESMLVMENVGEDMRKLGFTDEDIERMEMEEAESAYQFA